MEKEFTKSYAINRIAELSEELERLKEINLYNKDLAKNSMEQLTEKYKEISNLRRQMRAMENEYKIRLNQMKEDSIKIAIAQLNEVKAKFGYKFNSQLMVSSKGLCEYIDNQIKELKGE